jgi:hypothetical protein
MILMELLYPFGRASLANGMSCQCHLAVDIPEKTGRGNVVVRCYLYSSTDVFLGHFSTAGAAIASLAKFFAMSFMDNIR